MYILSRASKRMFSFIIASVFFHVSSAQETVILQHGVNGYTGFGDKELRERTSTYEAKMPPSDSVMLVMRG